jgi:hypothetical protein
MTNSSLRQIRRRKSKRAGTDSGNLRGCAHPSALSEGEIAPKRERGDSRGFPRKLTHAFLLNALGQASAEVPFSVALVLQHRKRKDVHSHRPLAAARPIRISSQAPNI